MNKLSKEDYIKMYRQLFLIRRTEETMVEYHHHTPITELPHVSIGQEAISVGTCFGLRKSDKVAPSLRTRGAFLCKGVSSRSMMAGAFAKDIPETRGKNTSHHMGDKTIGLVGGTGIVGGHVPVAVGVSLADKIKKEDSVTVVYFGDGATNRGDIHEAMNLAAIWNLPIIFICENNGYAISTSVQSSTKIEHLSERAKAYGMPGVTIDGNDVLEVYKTSQEAYARARAGEGPTFIECVTYRWRGHSERDPRDDRPQEEIIAWKEKCPVKRFRQFLVENKIESEQGILQIEDSVEKEIEDAIRYAEDLPYPPVEILETNVYSE